MDNAEQHKEQQTNPTAGEIDISSLAVPNDTAGAAGGADPRDVEIAELKHRLQVESAEQGRLRKANEELRRLQEENARLKSENEKLTQRKLSDLLTEEEKSAFDSQQLASLDKALSAKFSDLDAARKAETDRIREELKRRDATIAAGAKAQFNAEVERLAPGLAALVNENVEAWRRWSGDRRRKASVAQAFADHDAATVAEFLGEFVTSSGIRANGGGVAARPGSSFSPIGGSHPVTTGGDTTTYTLAQYNAEMRKAADDLNAGRITVDEYRGIKKKFDTALAEGRIVQR